MARKKKIYDNNDLYTILRGYQFLNQLTPEALEIIDGEIDKEFIGGTSKHKCNRKYILRVIILCREIGYDNVSMAINTAKVLKGDKPLRKSMLYIYSSIASKAAQSLLEAYNHGVQITYPLRGDARSLHKNEAKKIRDMINNNTSLATIKEYINGL